ncbi:site-specific integrase [uncultured Sphaerochaeta sp.]|uniref:tyrosine-type recombinase/integrase n=1 Tax=uncultured Sphaerochaeta sp. TaxID=886478 RepID=UPI002AA7F91A|nr:site-specific integrase [uncultured Sphaerochaeta sp.]
MRHEYTLFKRFKDTKNRKGVVWYFYYYDVNGKRQSKSTGLSKKYEADQFAQEFLNEDDRTDITLQEYTIDFFVWDVCPWIKRQHAKGKPFSMSIANQRRSHLTTYILPKFGHRILSSLNRIEIENWLIDLKKTVITEKDKKKVTTKLPLSNQTKNHILYTFRIVLREAEREALVPFNCLATVESLGGSSKPRDIFSKDELAKLFPADLVQMEAIWGRKEYAYIFYLLATTGMRVGEVRALCWKHVIWKEDRNALRIEQTVKHDNSIGTTKTQKSRIVVLTKRAQDYLNDWLHSTPFDQMRDLIFFGQDRNSPVTGRTLLNRFAKALETVKIDTTGRNLVIHSFRHTYNTMLKPLMPTEVLQSMTGHSSVAMTELYNHPTFDDEYNAIMEYQKALDSLD